jgi:phosphatidylethanolamine/phosphatidyl-N-methylethanolamine N-methyltransferase
MGRDVDEGDAVTSQPRPADPTAGLPPRPAIAPDPEAAPAGEPAVPEARTPRVSDSRAARRAFVAAALRNPGKVGAVAPTSRAMAELITRIVPRSGAPVVVELGPGTGAVTGVIDDRLPPAARHLAIELDPEMAAYLQRTHPGLEVIEGDAAKLGALLAEHDVERADAVVSGLPWSLFDEGTQASILGQIAILVGPGGAFTTFAYRHGMVLSAARRFRRALHETFEEVVVTATVWRNVPPAFVYVCRRPRSG